MQDRIPATILSSLQGGGGAGRGGQGQEKTQSQRMHADLERQRKLQNRRDAIAQAERSKKLWETRSVWGFFLLLDPLRPFFLCAFSSVSLCFVLHTLVFFICPPGCAVDFFLITQTCPSPSFATPDLV